MADIFPKEKRSDIMSKVKSKNNRSTEQKMVSLFKREKITGWRRQWDIIGHPDFVFLNKKVAVFVDGCFWHGCPKCYKTPKSNSQFWDDKILRNIKRDNKNNRLLRKNGWSVFRIKEHELKKDKIPPRLLKRLLASDKLNEFD